jgi:hypothetical protein
MALTTGIARAALNAADPCGDVAAGWARDGGYVLAIADGLGHGADAFLAASTAIDHVGNHLADAPLALFPGMNDALRSTRGAAVGVAAIDFSLGRLTFAAVGNTRAALFGWQVLRLDGFAGIVGAGYRRLAAQTIPFHPGDRLVMWTDGVDERLSFDSSAVRDVDPDTLARGLLDQFSCGSDDSCVLVAHWAEQR